jgi:hypothetical protein
MYRIIFRAIGYDGQRTDYATRGWPSGVFPPVKVTEERNGDAITYKASVVGRDLMWSGPLSNGQWTWESRVPGVDKPESEGFAINHHHALEQVYSAASSSKMVDDLRAINQAEG